MINVYGCTTLILDPQSTQSVIQSFIKLRQRTCVLDFNKRLITCLEHMTPEHNHYRFEGAREQIGKLFKHGRK